MYVGSSSSIHHPTTTTNPQNTQARALLAAPDGDGHTSSSATTTYNQAVDQLIAYRALLEEHDAVDNPAAVPTSSLALPSPSDDAAARRRRLLRDGRYVGGLVCVRGKWLVLVTDAPYILLYILRRQAP
jgi:hypothetical protein